MIFGVLNQGGHNTYKLDMCSWTNSSRQIGCQNFIGTKQQVLMTIKKLNCILINATVTKNNTFYFRQYRDSVACIKQVAETVREHFVRQYGSGTDLCGYCIEASETLQAILMFMGIHSKTVEGWCEFDDEYYGSDRPYDPHTWLEVPSNNKNGKPLYVDITADQFNPGMYRETKYPGVILNIGLPHGMCYNEPVIYDD